MSVKKTKKKKDYTSMKSVGVKSVDETFKVPNVTKKCPYLCSWSY
jgi:hypothetical protein